jgi:hypothetical protein
VYYHSTKNRKFRSRVEAAISLGTCARTYTKHVLTCNTYLHDTRTTQNLFFVKRTYMNYTKKIENKYSFFSHVRTGLLPYVRQLRNMSREQLFICAMETREKQLLAQVPLLPLLLKWQFPALWCCIYFGYLYICFHVI